MAKSTPELQKRGARRAIFEGGGAGAGASAFTPKMGCSSSKGVKDVQNADSGVSPDEDALPWPSPAESNKSGTGGTSAPDEPIRESELEERQAPDAGAEAPSQVDERVNSTSPEVADAKEAESAQEAAAAAAPSSPEVADAKEAESIPRNEPETPTTAEMADAKGPESTQEDAAKAPPTPEVADAKEAHETPQAHASAHVDSTPEQTPSPRSGSRRESRRKTRSSRSPSPRRRTTSAKRRSTLHIQHDNYFKTRDHEMPDDAKATLNDHEMPDDAKATLNTFFLRLEAAEEKTRRPLYAATGKNDAIHE